MMEGGGGEHEHEAAMDAALIAAVAAAERERSAKQISSDDALIAAMEAAERDAAAKEGSGSDNSSTGSSSDDSGSAKAGDGDDAAAADLQVSSCHSAPQAASKRGRACDLALQSATNRPRTAGRSDLAQRTGTGDRSDGSSDDDSDDSDDSMLVRRMVRFQRRPARTSSSCPAPVGPTAEAQQRPRPVQGHVWAQRNGAGRLVAIIRTDAQRVQTVRLYRHWELITHPFGNNKKKEEDHQLVAADKLQTSSISAFLMTHRPLGTCMLKPQVDSQNSVPVCSSFVYHERFPVSFRSRPTPNEVLSSGHGQLCVWSASAQDMQSLRHVPDEADHLDAVQLTQQDTCSQDAAMTQPGEEVDDNDVMSDEEDDDDIGDDPRADIETEDMDSDEDMDEPSAVADICGIREQIQAIELYAGCGGLGHLAGCSHGVEMSIKWAVECMPAAAATYRANHSCALAPAG